jgi:hypothetical protein
MVSDNTQDLFKMFTKEDMKRILNSYSPVYKHIKNFTGNFFSVGIRLVAVRS